MRLFSSPNSEASTNQLKLWLTSSTTALIIYDESSSSTAVEVVANITYSQIIQESCNLCNLLFHISIHIAPNGNYHQMEGIVGKVPDNEGVR